MGGPESYFAREDEMVRSDIPQHIHLLNYCIVICCSCRESGIWSQCVDLKLTAVRVILALYVSTVLAKWGGPAF